MKKTILIVSGTLLIILGITVPLATTVVTFLLPETFASRAMLLAPANSPTASANGVLVLQSPALLDQVITNLNLPAEWGQKYKQPGALPLARCRGILQASLTITMPAKTSVLGISVACDNRADDEEPETCAFDA